MEISVVIPVYGCREALPELHKRLTDTLVKITEDYEIILVDDCCPQNSWEDIVKMCSEDSKVKGIHLSRNFGQQKAVTAGVDEAAGNWVVVMDCDLQDPPEAITTLYEKAMEGYDVVAMRRVGRKDGFFKKLSSKLYYMVFDYLSGMKMDNAVSNYSIASRTVIDSFKKLREQNRDYMAVIRWLGFRYASIDYKAEERFSGKSSYNFFKRIRLAMQIITSQTNRPLVLSINIGFFIAFVAFLYIIWLGIQYFTGTTTIDGWTTTIASIYLVGGIILIFMGLIGLYIGNIFNEVKNRPIYVVAQKLNFDADDEEN